MKDINIDTVGGRLRSCRKKLGYSLEQMAQEIDISPNYVSVIERNVKRASDSILRKVASLAGVSFDWLKNGDEKEADITPGMRFARNIDASLFLNLVLWNSEGSISRETIATVLNIDEGMLEDILKGTARFDLAWENGFANIAQRIEISDLIEKLHRIVSFLEHEQTRKIDFELVRLIRRCLSEEYKDDFIYHNQYRPAPKDCADIWQSNRNTADPVKHFDFFQETTQDRWQVKLYSEMHGSLLEEVLFRALDPRDRTNGNTVLIFSDRDVYEESLNAKNVALQRIGNTFQNKNVTIGLMLVNPDTMCIEKKEFYEVCQ